MKDIKLKYLASLALLFMLTGCLTNEAGNLNKKNVGTLGGAVAGGLIGSTVGKGSGQMVAIAAGALLGSLAGHTIGASLDKQDIESHNNTQYKALEYNRTGSAAAWNNPDTGASGKVIPTRTYHDKYGEVCREYTQTIKIGEKTQEGFGKACRRSDGSWEIIK